MDQVAQHAFIGPPRHCPHIRRPRSLAQSASGCWMSVWLIRKTDELRADQQLATDTALQTLKWLDARAARFADRQAGDVSEKLVADAALGGKKRGKKALGRKLQGSGDSRERG